MFIDGLLYVLIAVFGAAAGMFSTDEAAKYIEPATLFWLRGFCAVNSATWLALKMFRSTAFSEHRDAKKAAPNPDPVADSPRTPV